MQPSNPSQPWWRRCCFRLSVRALMILVLVVGGEFGWIIRNARVQQEAVAAIKRAGGRVGYDDNHWWPKWLVNLFGINYFENVLVVEFIALTDLEAVDFENGLAHLDRLTGLRLVILRRSQVTDSELVHLKALTSLECLDLSHTWVTDAGLVHLKGLVGLRSLKLNGTRVTGSGFEHLAGLMNLQFLDLFDTDVADTGMRHLSGLSRLERLELGNTNVTDAGVVHLKTMTSLRELDLRGTAVGDAGGRELQTALPNARIEYTRRDPVPGR